MEVTPLTRPDINTAVRKYGPIIRCHPDEKYDMCSVDYFLSNSTLHDSKSPDSTLLHPESNQLPQGPKEGQRYYFTLDDSAKSGKLSIATSYVNAFWDKKNPYTDLQFWLFWAYNGPGTAKFDSLLFDKTAHTGTIDLTPLGEHYGDWEYVAIRIDNRSKEMIGVLLSAHGKAAIYENESISQNFQLKDGTHPIVYSSRNGHANFPKVGPNYTENRKILGIPVGLEFNLLNTTADGGNSLDCSQNFQLVAAEWLQGTDAVSSPAWVKYPYRWGPEGTAVTMNANTLGEFIRAALGSNAPSFLSDNVLVIAASHLLQIFVRADINGAAAPATQAPWKGQY